MRIWIEYGVQTETEKNHFTKSFNQCAPSVIQHNEVFIWHLQLQFSLERKVGAFVEYLPHSISESTLSECLLNINAADDRAYPISENTSTESLKYTIVGDQNETVA